MIVKLMTVFEFYHLSKNFSKYLHFSDRSQIPDTAFAPKRTFLLLFTGWQRSGLGAVGVVGVQQGQQCRPRSGWGSMYCDIAMLVQGTADVYTHSYYNFGFNKNYKVCMNTQEYSHYTDTHFTPYFFFEI